MGLVSSRYQHLGMLRARQQLLELLVLTWLGVNLGDTLQGEARLLDTTPLRTRRLLDATDLLGSCTRRLEAGTIAVERLERRATSPGINHGNMMCRIEQALMFMLAAQIHHHADALG